MTQDEVIQVFRKSGALLEGHFILRSGLHSRQFFQCALALQHMPDVEKLGAALAAQVRPLGVTTVIAPAMGGLVIGQEVARQLGVRFIFVEKEEGKLVLRRGFKIAAGEKLLVVEDVVTKGGRVQETMDIVRAHHGVVAVGADVGAEALQFLDVPEPTRVEVLGDDAHTVGHREHGDDERLVVGGDTGIRQRGHEIGRAHV